MKILLSPAKTLDFESELPTSKMTIPVFLKEAKQVHKVMQKYTPAELSGLLDISDKLAELNWQRNQVKRFGSRTIGPTSRQAIYAFNGDVYLGLDAYSIPEEKIESLQQKVRILSGMYGMLRPLDIIQPYRLEMGIKLSVGDHSNLYELWKALLTRKLNSEMKKGELLVNLASQEYFSAVDQKKLKGNIVTPEFKDYKNGKLQMVSFFAKKARGLMTRYIIDTESASISDLKKFNYDGYAFDESLSDQNKLIFIR